MKKILFLIILGIIILLINKLKKEKYEDGKYKYTAIIVEPREHKALSFVLNNYLENLSDEWGIVICHGTKNIEYINNIINNDLSKYRDRIRLANLQVDNLNTDQLNKLLTSEKFYEYIPTEIFLFFQTDSMICPQFKDLLSDFLEYDYVGAPWEDNLVKGNVGNGGLSIRRKSKMIEIIKNCKYNGKNEDLFFSKSCNQVSINKPDAAKAGKFSNEITYNKESFGIHKFWNYHSPKYIKKKEKTCTGLKTLQSLQ